jgi:hypothetical protein
MGKKETDRGGSSRKRIAGVSAVLRTLGSIYVLGNLCTEIPRRASQTRLRSEGRRVDVVDARCPEWGGRAL